jgi:hypothetical protein
VPPATSISAVICLSAARQSSLLLTGAVTNSSCRVPTIRERKPFWKRNDAVKRTQYVISVTILESLRSKRGKAPGQSLSTVPYAEKVTVPWPFHRDSCSTSPKRALGCTCDFPPISAHSDRDYSTSRRSWYRRVVIWSGLFFDCRNYFDS